MQTTAIDKQFVDGDRCAPLKDIEINARIEEESATDRQFVGCPGKLGVGSPSQRLYPLLRFQPA